MGRRSPATRSSANAWLPGFEPEGLVLQATAATFQLPTDVPPSCPPTLVAMAAAHVTVSALQRAPTTLNHDTATVLGTEDIHFESFSAADALCDEEPEAAALKPWAQFVPDDYAPPSGDKARIDANLAAIRLCKQLQASTKPSDAQQHELLRYAGWGGLARIFEELPRNPFADQRGELSQLLSPAEFDSARSTVTDAFYTDPVLVQALWGAVQRLGFRGGRIIEPTAGTGLFLAGMPASIATRSEVTAVEKDSVSGAILQSVFAPLGVNVQVCGLERASVPHGFYDLAISNVPFGDYRVSDTRKVGYADFSIHNWCIAKCVDLVRPGGLVVAITSRFTLDSSQNGHRRWLEANAELLGAVRLPQGAFKRHAGTDVVADVLFLRRRQHPQFESDARADWLERENAPREMLAPGQEHYLYRSGPHGQQEVARTLNKYFAKRPGMVLGQLVHQTGQHGRTDWLPQWKGTSADFAARLRDVLATLPESIYEEPKAMPAAGFGGAQASLARVDATSSAKPGSFVLHGGRIHISEGATWIDVDDVYAGKARERVVGLMKIRTAARDVIEHQSRSQDDLEFKRLQNALNVAYDSFVSKHGNVHDRANVRVFRTDPEFPLLLSLEVFNEDEERFEKAAIFSRRTVGRREPPAAAEDAREAMLISLAVHGRIVLPDMAKRLGMHTRTVVKRLEDEGLAYVDPQDGRWKPRDEYLSGHIRDKIAAAKAAGPRFQRNLLALEAVVPPDLGPGDVEVRLGAPWVPTDVIATFLEALVKPGPGRVKVTYEGGTATWSINAGAGDPRYCGDHTLNNTTWGTADRSAVELLEAALNQVPPKVTRTAADKSTYVDKKATLAAREKYECIKQEFRKWAYADESRRDRLLRIYNDEFNQIKPRDWDGSHLLLPGMSGVIEPYRHQLDCVWRAVAGGNLLLWHIVGAGKTFTIAAACMELRRLGKAAKPVILVPNHLLMQFTGDFVRFYPNANVLMASKEDFQGDKRREFVARVATGDWDAVVMTHATFERLPLRPETEKRFLGELLSQARLALQLATDSGAKRSVKQCEKVLKTFEAKLERAIDAGAKDDLIYFDDLGIDYIAGDEAHAWKNLLKISKMPQIAGLPNAASNRAFDVWMKTQCVMAMRGGKEEGVLLSTATPISNSVAEQHVFMKYLMPTTLKRLGLYEFDAWAATFGEAVTGMEVSPDGSGYRLNTRFSRFTNIPELMSIMRLCTDIRTEGMIKLPVPTVAGGKPRTITCKPTPELKAYTKELVERADRIRNGSVDPSEDNMLSVSNCGRKAALDMRLVASAMKPDPNGKVATCVREVLRIYHATTDRRGTQVIFCDLSTPKAKGFSVYDELRALLLAANVPDAEIAFIHDYESDSAKESLFRKVRAGHVRIVIGSTSKLGTGTNFQKRLKAVAQLDQPWRPADVAQRDGRAKRPGNEWDEIELLRFVTEGSFDAYQAQTLEVKARFIDQLTACNPGVRTIEDISVAALTYAEIKAIASGNPLVLEKATVDAEIVRLSSLESSWQDERWRMSHRRLDVLNAVETLRRNAQHDVADAADVAAQVANGWKLDRYASQRAKEAATVAEALGQNIRVASARLDRGSVVAGSIAGFDVLVRKQLGIFLELQSLRSGLRIDVNRGEVELRDASTTGELVLSALAELVDLPQRQQERLAKLEEQLRNLEAELAKPFEHGEKLHRLILRQREIEASLDLDKDEAGTATASEAGAAKASEEELAEA